MFSTAASNAPDRLRQSPVIVGYSGGLDSSVLLHWLSASTGLCIAGLRAIHVHHGLQADADAWAEHCAQECRRLGVPLQVARVEVSRDSGRGPEAAARHARHVAFESALRTDEILALAHHRDDQGETFLLRALRASGPDGLAAMQPWRRFGHGWLWRPLLELPREELLRYAQAHGLRWIDDPSNTDATFDRNFLRQRIMPLLRERWPQADASFARSAHLCGEAAGLLGAEDARELARLRTADPHTISRSGLRALPPSRRARVLRRWIDELGLPALPGEGIARIEAEVLDARDDADPQFAWQDATVRGWRDLLHAHRRREALAVDWQCSWDGRAPLVLPDGAQLQLSAADGFDGKIRVHARHGGERIRLPGREHSHSLKHVLQDLGVPPWIRERLPLLSDEEGQLMAAGDLVFSAGFEAWLKAHAAQLRWIL